MTRRPGIGPRIFLAARPALCAFVAGSGIAAVTAHAQQPAPSASTRATNLGTLIVAPREESSSRLHKKVEIQRSSLNLDLKSNLGGDKLGIKPTSPSLSPPITAPRPLHIVPPRYPNAAYASNAKGSVTVSFTVRPNGRTSRIRIVKSNPSKLFDAAARAAVRKWRYRPAMQDGKPVPMAVSETLIFRPPGSRQRAVPKPARGRTKERAALSNHVPSNVHPVRIVPPQYPATAYRARQGGSVTVRFLVLPDGHTGDIRIVSSTSHGLFDAAARDAVEQWRFEPVSNPTQVVQTIRFTPPSG